MNDAAFVQVSGALFLSLVQACVNLNFFVDDEAKAWLDQVHLEGWYPLTVFNRLLDIVVTQTPRRQERKDAKG